VSGFFALITGVAGGVVGPLIPLCLMALKTSRKLMGTSSLLTLAMMIRTSFVTADVHPPPFPRRIRRNSGRAHHFVLRILNNVLL